MARREIIDDPQRRTGGRLTRHLDGRNVGRESFLENDAFGEINVLDIEVGAVFEYDQASGKWRIAEDCGNNGGVPWELRHTVAPTEAEQNPFLPPYNFVCLGDGPPREPWADLLNRAGHERFTGLCGQITCELQTLTPLFVPDAEGQELWPATKDTHRKKAFFRVDGVPAIPPASLKGPIRSVFEALTGSCLGVYESEAHQTKMGWRRALKHPVRKPARLYRDCGGEIDEGVKLQEYRRQARICFDGVSTLKLQDRQQVTVKEIICLREFQEDGKVVKTWEAVDAEVAVPGGTLTWRARSQTFSSVKIVDDLKWVETSGGAGAPKKLRIPDALKPRLKKSGIVDGDTVAVEARRLMTDRYAHAGTATSLYGTTRYWKWYVTEVTPSSGPKIQVESDRTTVTAVAHIVCLRGPAATEANKSNDRVFWDLDPNVQDVTAEAFNACIGAHESSDPKLDDPTNDLKGWKAMLREGVVAPGEGPLVYVARTRHKDTPDAPPGGLFIGPVAMYREPYDHTVDSATPDSHKPGACNLEAGLCPACALFGGLFPEKPGADPDQPLAGRVSINTAWLQGNPENAEFEPVPLRILGKPRPSYFPFYLAPADGRAIDYNATAWEYRPPDNKGRARPPQPSDASVATHSCHIRGRKFYWHNPTRWEKAGHGEDWTEPYRLQPAHWADAPQHLEFGHSKQNATVELLRPGAIFSFTVDFENLSEEELKLLVWCLNLEHGMAHHFGMGKPIGLGSARVRVTSVTRRDLATSYRSLLEDDEKEWDGFDPEQPAALLEGLPDAGWEARHDLRSLLTVEPFGDNPPHIDYIPAEVLEPDEGFEYYMKHRHKPLRTVAEAVVGWRMDADNL